MPKGDFSKTKESIVPLQGVVRGGKLAAILDHEGKEIGGLVTTKNDEATGGVDFIDPGKEAAIRAIRQTDPVFPDDTIRITVSQNPVALPCTLKRIRCVAGSAISLAVYDDVNQMGQQFLGFPQTLSAGQEASIPDGGLVAMHGVYCKFTGTATFDITVGAQK